MPSLIDLRRRIRSVKNMQQITKAMKMVSAAKLRRAQEHAIASRPYARMLARVLANITQASGGIDETAELALLQVREEKRVHLIVVTSDTGLAGAFNSNLLRTAHRFVDERSGSDLRIEAVGRKGRDYFRKRQYNVSAEHVGIVDKPRYDQAAEIADRLIQAYRNSEIDAVYIATNEFKNVMAPRIVLKKVLPVELSQELEEAKALEKDPKKKDGQNKDRQDEEAPIDYIYEQPPHELLRELLPRYVEMEIYRAMLESISAYHAARMTAMDAASSNAGEVIDKLTLNLNRARQANITREIIEIVSGAAALG